MFRPRLPRDGKGERAGMLAACVDGGVRAWSGEVVFNAQAQFRKSLVFGREKKGSFVVFGRA
eukprot:3477331-Lingulodinium_polyedra.AAC.1